MSDSLDILGDLTESTINGASQEEEEEELTTGEVLQRLKTAWINEKFAPDLLPPQTEILECMMAQTKEMEKNLTQVAKTDFRVPLHKMELARIRFVIASYLRARLAKIQDYIHTLPLDEDDEEEAEKIMTPQEWTFARNYKANLEGHFKTLALKHMPGDFGQINPRKMDPKLPAANLDASVFVQVDEAVHGVMLEDVTNQGKDDEVDFEVGNQHIVRYNAVAEHVRSGAIRLI